MKLLKLVPDNTNLDFMRWRNLALILVDRLRLSASLALVARSRPQPRRRLRRRADGPRDLRAAASTSRAAQRGRSPAARRSEHPGIRRRQTSYQIRLPKPRGRRGRREPSPQAAYARCSTKQYPGVAHRRRRDRIRQGQRGACATTAPRDRARDARHRDLHLVPLRMAVRRRRVAHPVPRRLDDAGLLRVHPAAGRPQRRRRAS